jgi:RHS repeat-associated protein
VPNSESQSGTLDDFTYRRYAPVQGRWIAPDPSGIAAVNPSDPQSWNRYAYVGNRPLSNVDPLGLDLIAPCDPDVDPSCGGGGGGGYCPPEFESCDPGCDPELSCGGPPPPGGPGGGGPPPPSSAVGGERKGGVWPNNQTLGLPAISTSPLSLGDLLGLSPGTECGDLVSCLLIDQFTNCPCGGDCMCPRLPGANGIWATIKADIIVAAALMQATSVLLDRCSEVIQECKNSCSQQYAHDPSGLPGQGPDIPGRLRRCIRECAASQGCFSF